MYAIVELKHDMGRRLVVPVKNIINFKSKFNQTDDFLCYWTTNMQDDLEDFEFGYKKTFTGENAIFKVFIVTLADTLDEANKCLAGKRIKSVAKRFRDPLNTDEEIKGIETKKKKNEKKNLNALISKAKKSNAEYLVEALNQPESASAEKDCTLKKIAEKRSNNNSTKPPLVLSKQQPCTSAAYLKEMKNHMLSISEEQGSEVPHIVQSDSVAATSCNSFDPLVTDVVNDMVVAFPLNCELNVVENADPVVPALEVEMPDVQNSLNSQSNILRSNEMIIIDIDELNQTNKELATQVKNLTKERDCLKLQLERATKRNLMLQDYLVAVNERVPELLFEEKDGGRLYREGIFLNKKQCLVLDKPASDREFLNNLATAIFGREVLSTHSVTGLPSNKTKGAPKLKLDTKRIELIYDIMEARSVANKTKKLEKTEINEIIGKKCTNLSAYDNRNSKDL